MSRFASVGEDPHLIDVFRRFPKGIAHLMHFHDEILRGPSEFSVAEREMLAAFVSALNQCGFCAGTHALVAELFGMPEDRVRVLIETPQDAGLEPKWLPLLSYIRKLTLAPATVTDGDARAIFAAGWSEEALFDAVLICGLFNMSNRIVEGSGVRLTDAHLETSRARHAAMADSHTPYAEAGRRIGIIDATANLGPDHD